MFHAMGMVTMQKQPVEKHTSKFCRIYEERMKTGLFKVKTTSPMSGKMALVSYPVYFNNPGRYYVWVRAYSTGTEDNGLHVGLDGTWPELGQRL